MRRGSSDDAKTHTPSAACDDFAHLREGEVDVLEGLMRKLDDEMRTASGDDEP